MAAGRRARQIGRFSSPSNRKFLQRQRLNRRRSIRSSNESLCGISFRAVTRHDPFAQDLVRRFHRVPADGEFLLAGVLSEEFQAELKILEFLRAISANWFGLFKAS